MKIFLCIVLLITVITLSQSDGTPDIKKNINDCIVEAKVPIDFESIQTILMNNPMAFSHNSNLKCFSACMMRKKGNIKDGRIDPQAQLDEVVSEMPKSSYEIFKGIIISCADIANKNEDVCEVAESYAECVAKSLTSIS